jgi:hypothetical protein
MGRRLVGATVTALGGDVKAAAAGNTSPQTVHKYKADGCVYLLKVAVGWADALHPTDDAAWRALVTALVPK